MRRCAATATESGERCRLTAAYSVHLVGGEWEVWPDEIGQGQYCRLHAGRYARALNVADAFRRERNEELRHG